MEQCGEDVMNESRRTPRTRVLKGAIIILKNRSSTLSCMVRNLTNSGACLDVASTVGIPAEFELSFDGGRSARACRALWRRADKLGIEFEV